MSHNPSSRLLLDHQPWIEEIVQVPFPTDTEKSWEVFYERYSEHLAGTELRFHCKDHRSTLHERFDDLRGTTTAVESIEPDSMRVAFPTVEYPCVDLLVHLFAGQSERAADINLQDIRCSTLRIGSPYLRPGHIQETGVQLHPLSLARCVMHARGVIGTESSVAYMASMLGVPFVMLYREDQTFDLVQRGLSDWDWYFGSGMDGCLYLKWPLSEEDSARLKEWVSRLQ